MPSSSTGVLGYGLCASQEFKTTCKFPAATLNTFLTLTSITLWQLNTAIQEQHLTLSEFFRTRSENLTVFFAGTDSCNLTARHCSHLQPGTDAFLACVPLTVPLENVSGSSVTPSLLGCTRYVKYKWATTKASCWARRAQLGKRKDPAGTFFKIIKKKKSGKVHSRDKSS